MLERKKSLIKLISEFSNEKGQKSLKFDINLKNNLTKLTLK